MKVKTIIPRVWLWREQKERCGLDIELSNVSLQAQNASRLHKMHSVWLHLGMHQSDRREMLCSESYLKCTSGMCVCVHKNAHLQACQRAAVAHTKCKCCSETLETSQRAHGNKLSLFFVSRLPLIFSSNYQTRSKDHALWFGETAGWAWKLFLLSSM